MDVELILAIQEITKRLVLNQQIMLAWVTICFILLAIFIYFLEINK